MLQDTLLHLFRKIDRTCLTLNVSPGISAGLLMTYIVVSEKRTRSSMPFTKAFQKTASDMYYTGVHTHSQLEREDT